MPRIDLPHLIKTQPWIRQLRRRRGLAYYLSERGEGLHYGMFQSFDEARRWLPASKAFDHETYTDEYVEVRTKRIYSFDYPVIFWLGRAFDDGAATLFDIGGSVGVHCHAYRRFLDYPDGLTWKVYELAASVARGRKLAVQQGASELSFTETLAPEREHADIWVSAGAIEFIEHGQLDVLLPLAGRKPRHILLNKLPLHDGPAYVSTQNIGKRSFVPHHVYNRQRYVERIEGLGYRLVDSWEVPERSFSVPGWPENSFSPYGGLYFRAV